MKTKLLCMLIASAFIFSISINAFANCGSCDKAKASCCSKVKEKTCESCKAKPAEKVEKEKKEEDIPLDKVPEKIKAAAEKAVKGIKLTEAELEDGVYELEGKVGDDEYEIKITPEGKVIKIEKEDDDD